MFVTTYLPVVTIASAASSLAGAVVSTVASVVAGSVVSLVVALLDEHPTNTNALKQSANNFLI